MATPQSTASTSSISPGRRTRLQEKEELQNLNDRFVAYIDRVRHQRDAESTIRTLQASQEEVAESIRKVYESELNEARSLIDETAKEKAHYQIVASKNAERIQELEGEKDDLQAEIQKLRRELGDAHRKNEMLDKQCKAAVSEKHSFQQRVKELEGEVEDLSAQVKSLRDSLEQETLNKVDLQNNIQSLKEELAFKKRIHDEEMSTMRKRSYQLEYSESSYYGDDFSERVQAAIDEAREEIDRETELYRVDLERTYRDKINMLEAQCARYSDAIANLKEQIRDYTTTGNSYKDRLAKLQKENEQLNEKLSMKENQLRSIKQQHNDEIFRLNNELLDLRKMYDEKLHEYEELLDLRVKLEQEILTLSALLREEEARLDLGGATPTKQRRRRRPEPERTGTSHSKKTKRSQELSSSSTAVGSIQINDVDPDGRFVSIKNTSDKVEQLGTFKLVHEIEDTGEKVEFRFHAKSKLQGGASVTVWASKAEGAVHQPPTDIIWKSCNMWGSGAKTVTTLCTKTGEVLATFTQRKESATSTSFTLDETDAGVRTFPSLPESPVPRQTQREIDPLPQGDPQARDPGKCIIS